tara:strand:- start:420 stop:686 length:267 start_codon:yes stop_codon:yes gene_type:complete
MKKKHTLLAISIGTAIGLFIGVNTDFERTNFFKMIKEVRSCVDQGLSVKEKARLEGEGIYQVKDYTPKGDATLCKDKICLPPSKRIKG